MIHQTQSNDTVGNWEYNSIKRVEGDDIYLSSPLTQEYTSGNFNVKYASEVTQMVVVPYAVDGTINGKISTIPWDGTTGGIIALRTTKKLTVSSKVDGSCKGFRGGLKSWAYKAKNCHKTAGWQGESWRRH